MVCCPKGISEIGLVIVCNPCLCVSEVTSGRDSRKEKKGAESRAQCPVGRPAHSSISCSFTQYNVQWCVFQGGAVQRTLYNESALQCTAHNDSVLQYTVHIKTVC